MLDAIRSNLSLDRGATVLGVSLQSRYTGLESLARYIVKHFPRLERIILQRSSRLNSTFCNAAKDALLKLNKYNNSGVQSVIKMATCLDPRYKLRHFKRSAPKDVVEFKARMKVNFKNYEGVQCTPVEASQ
ncbi:hypothetical protein MIR68_000821 [Amoeboaphelidium protococcarum]|nr:hypothetical protein MIR68_000821 [Amoeboaphelidium protococcarum]